MRAPLRPVRRRSRSRNSGQALIIFVLAFTVLVGFTGLSVDVGHAYVAHRQTQDATDAAALAGGRQLLTADIIYNVPPNPSSGGSCCSATLTAAHDYATQNGFPTTLNETCESYSSTGASPHLDEYWFNSGYSGACGASSGFATKVEFHNPPVFSSGEPTPPDCSPSSQFRFNCVQVIITSLISNYFLGALGFPRQYTVTKATAFAQPPNNTLGSPPATAIYLYEPQKNCNDDNQCFNDSGGAPAPSRSQLSCAHGNCPTFWAQNGTKPSIYGFDGSTLSPATDTPAVEANGDMVIADDTTFCDPYGNGSSWCSGGAPAIPGPQGYSTPAGSLLFCQAQGGVTYPQTAPTTPNTCSANPAGWPGAKHLNGNGVAFTPCNTTCSITVTPNNPPDCGGLVLNGESVQSHYSSGSGCYPPNGDEYTIRPGKYQYIVINHGQYFFDGGLFEITGSAPVYTTTAGGNYTATGIDHANEGNNEFDLCNTYNNNNASTQCPNLTAGVWIGHGKGGFAAASAGGAGGTCAGGGGVGSQAGGGDNTQVSGNGVTFKLDSTSAGFVVTNEVQYVHLSSPGSGHPELSNLPVLIDEENNSFIHLDGQHGSGSTLSGYSGIVYQTPSATAGGVELNPGTGGNQQGTLTGQVLAYTFTTFGQQGHAVDFSGGYGAGGGLSISSSGHNESEIIVTNNSTYSPRAVDNGNGTETFSLDYTDEWALDGYDTYIKINSGSPIFFSQNVWSCGATCGASLPPEANSTPSDSHPAQHGALASAGYSNGPGRPGPGNLLQGTRIVPAGNDWIETLTLGAQTYTFETLGDWTWGHEKDLTGNSVGNPDLAELNLTFPKPAAGTSFTLSIFMEDGDHCGDYASAQYTFPIAGGQPGGGQNNGGGVSLEE